MRNSQPVFAVVLDDPKVRIFGMSSAARNSAAAARARVAVVSRTTLLGLPDDALVVVIPADVAVEPALFAALPSVGEAPTRLTAPGLRGELLVGRGQDIALGVPPAATMALPAGLAWDVGSRAEVAATERALLLRTGKPTDGFVARHLNRRMSRPVSRALSHLGVTPNQATFMALAIGLAAGLALAGATYWTMVLGGLLFQLASAFDGVDGELARVTFRSSELGARLDTGSDYLSHLACLVGATVGYLREGPGPLGAGLAIALAAAVVLTLGVVVAFAARYGSGGTTLIVDQAVKRAAEDTGRPSLRAARTLFALLRRDAFSLAFFGLSFVGTRAVVPAALLFGLAVALATFALHWPRLVDAALAIGRERGESVSPGPRAVGARPAA